MHSLFLSFDLLLQHQLDKVKRDKSKLHLFFCFNNTNRLFFLKCDLIFQEGNRGYKEDSVKQKNAANQIEQQELKKEG